MRSESSLALVLSHLGNFLLISCYEHKGLQIVSVGILCSGESAEMPHCKTKSSFF